MCCRYYMEMSPALRPIVEDAWKSRLYQENVERIAKPLKTEGEIFPGYLVPVLAQNKSGRKSVFPMIWGYQIQGISRLVPNARSETASEKSSFQKSWAMHRCIIPASWYYEWEHIPAADGKSKAGAKYAILPRNSDLTYLCGLYRMEDNYPHFVILTRAPGESISFLHDRMPMILPKEAIDQWIDSTVNPYALVGSSLTDRVYEKAAERTN